MNSKVMLFVNLQPCTSPKKELSLYMAPSKSTPVMLEHRFSIIKMSMAFLFAFILSLQYTAWNLHGILCASLANFPGS